MKQELVHFTNKGMYQDTSISKSSDEFAFKNVNVRITAVDDNTLFSITNERGAEEKSIEITYNLASWKLSYETILIDEDNSIYGIYITSENQLQESITISLTVELDNNITESLSFAFGIGEISSDIIQCNNSGEPTIIASSVLIETSNSLFDYYINGVTVPGSSQVTLTSIDGKYLGRCIIGDYLIIFTYSPYIYPGGHPPINRIIKLTFDKGSNKFVGNMIYAGWLNITTPVETVGYYEREDIQKVYWVDGINQNRVINVAVDSEDQPVSFDFLPEITSTPSISVTKLYNGAGSFPAGTIQYFLSYYNKLGQETKIVNATSLYYLTESNKGGSPDNTITCSFQIVLSNLDTGFEYVRVYSAIRSTLDGPIDARIVGDYVVPTNGSNITLIDTGRNEEAIDQTMLYYIGGDKFIASTIEDKDNVLFFGNLKVDNIVFTEDEISAVQLDFANTISFEYFDTEITSFPSGASLSNETYTWSADNLQKDSKEIKHFKYGNIYRFGIQFIDSNGQYSDVVYIGDVECKIAPTMEDYIYVPKATFTWPNISQSQYIISRFEKYRIVIAETSESTRVVVAQGIINPTVFRLGDRVNNSGPYAIPSWITRPENTANSQHLEILGGHELIETGNGSLQVQDVNGFWAIENHELCYLNNVRPPIYEDDNGSPVDPDEDAYYIDRSIITLNSPEISSSFFGVEDLYFRIVGITINSYSYNDYELTFNNPNDSSTKLYGLTKKYWTMYPDTDFPRRTSLGAELPVYSSLTAAYPILSIWQKGGSFGNANDEKDILDKKLYSLYRYCSRNAYFKSSLVIASNIGLLRGEESLIKLQSNIYVAGNYDNLITKTNSYYLYGSTSHTEIWSPTGIYSSSNPIRIRVKYTPCALVELTSGHGWKLLPYISGCIARWDLENLYGSDYSDAYSLYPYWEQDMQIKPFLFQQTNINDSVFDKNLSSPAKTLNDINMKYPDTSLNTYTTPYLFIGEFCRNVSDASVLYGDVENTKWIPCGVVKDIGIGTFVSETEGDTFFQRYDCLRAYPYAEGDTNSVIDIVSFMVETYQNLDARYDSNRGPYTINYARPTNFGLYNTAYNQPNNIFKYNTINETLQYKNFPQQFAWSLNKNAVSEIDSWTSATLSNIYNVDGSYGPINVIEKLNDTLIGFQDRAIFVINFNNRTQISTEQGLPIELANSGKVDGITYLTRNYGCKNKFSIVNAKTGLYFIDDNNRTLMRVGKDGIADISSASGMSIWFRNAGCYDNVWEGGDLNHVNNPCFVVQYDSNRGDIYIMNGANSDEGCLVFNETLQTFTSFFNLYAPKYSFPLIYNFNGESFGLYSNKFYEMFADTSYSTNYNIEYRINPEPLTDKIFTNFEYIADVFNGTTAVDANPSGGEISVIKDIASSSNLPFNYFNVWNEYQSVSGTISINAWLEPTNKEMFRIHRVEIPSTGTYGVDRIRNPWIHLKLSRNSSGNSGNKMQFHSLVVKYFK